MSKLLIAALLIIFVLPLILYFLLSLNVKETINIIYFYNPRCIVHNQTETIMMKAKEKFGERINVTKIFANGFAGDPEDPEDVKLLREKYNATGVPAIVINEQEYKKSYDFKNFKSGICRQFKIKPIQCFI
ncbi:MAG: hypothetical protein J4428_05375 [Candidatus Aenigmarchaeota archaeon]|nr:hypothetical protein [Candidatus Aenigmarchaeota archaeon]